MCLHQWTTKVDANQIGRGMALAQQLKLNQASLSPDGVDLIDRDRSNFDSNWLINNGMDRWDQGLCNWPNCN